jgi:hypothetical protein
MRAPPDITYEYQPYIESLTRRLSWLGSARASFFARATAALHVPSLIYHWNEWRSPYVERGVYGHTLLVELRLPPISTDA